VNVQPVSEAFASSPDPRLLERELESRVSLRLRPSPGAHPAPRREEDEVSDLSCLVKRPLPARTSPWTTMPSSRSYW
jgi:hypothetical protein